MVRLRVTWDNRFAFLAALAVAFVLPSGANALGHKVWCVPNLGVNPSCTNVPTPDTLQGAVTSAAAGDTVLVGPGKYRESVIIDEIGHSRDGLALLGAQAGNDARRERREQDEESVIDGAGQAAGSTVIVEARNVRIDGFTAQGATAAVGTACGNMKNDCEDDTATGAGTPGTSNYWLNNTGSSSLPLGLCSPGRENSHH